MRKSSLFESNVQSILRFNILIVVAVLIMALGVFVTLRASLLKDAYKTGITMASNFAVEKQNDLDVYKTLIYLAAHMIDTRIESGTNMDEIVSLTMLYFTRTQESLGKDRVDLYGSFNGKVYSIGDPVFEPISKYENREWYRLAQSAVGQAKITDAYIDMLTKRRVITIVQKSRKADVIIAFDIFLDHSRFNMRNKQISAEDALFICDARGNIVYNHGRNLHSMDVLNAYTRDIVAKIKARALDNYSDYVINPDGEKRSVYYVMMENGWYTIFTSPHDKMLYGNTHVMAFIAFFAIVLVLLNVILWRNFRTNLKMERASDIVRVLGNSYYALYWINYEHGTYEMIKDERILGQRLQKSGAYSVLWQNVESLIEEGQKHIWHKEFALTNIRQVVLINEANFSHDFHCWVDGKCRWTNARIIIDRKTRRDEVALCFREVDAEKQQQLQEQELLQSALASSQQSEEGKKVFFRNVSHEMRTPLNAIIGLVKLSKSYLGETEKVGHNLDVIESSSQQLKLLIDDILDMSRMEQGSLALTNQVVNLYECLEQAAEPYRFQAETERKHFAVQLDIREPMIIADPGRLIQIFNNLLSNAFKFTMRGDTISLIASMISSSPERGKYKFVVADTGIGMAASYLPRLFEPYSREERASSNATGTGLGMPITKNLIEQMNGVIEVESIEGNGTTFTIIIPFNLAQETGVSAPKDDTASVPLPANATETAPVSLEGLTVLVAEDNILNMELVSEMLEMVGMHVAQAWNGQEAVQLFAQSPLHNIAIILMDMQMPEMNGCDAAQQIRALARDDAQTVPIIAVTANAFAEDISASLASGMNAHVAKPIDFNLLCKTMQSLLAEQRRLSRA